MDYLPLFYTRCAYLLSISSILKSIFRYFKYSNFRYSSLKKTTNIFSERKEKKKKKSKSSASDDSDDDDDDESSKKRKKDKKKKKEIKIKKEKK